MINPAQEMKELNAEMLRLVREKGFEKEDWMLLYDRDFERYIGNVPSMKERLSLEVPKRFQKFIDEVGETDNVLDVGCGDGYFLNIVKRDKPKTRVNGVDVSPNAIKHALDCNKDIKVQVGFAEELPFDTNTFDTVFCSQVLEHVRNPDDVVKELKRVCKHGGKVIVTVPIMRNLLDPLHNSFFNYYAAGDDVVGLWELFTQYFDDFKVTETWKFNKKNNEKIFYVRCIND